ncbi:MAG: HD domain-containing protein [Bacteroidetes bacterium]|nr:HD domain-containing protein [Bacteroidota bacterium]
MPVKEFFTREYDNIFRFHRCGAGGLAVASELTQLVDATLTMLWNELPEPSRDSFAVVALGGYGRCEMAPHSDVDVMVLFANEQQRTEHAATAQRFLHSLWNLGFDVGHSVRTIEDCLNLYQTDVDVWASVLESRYICGNTAVMSDYTARFLAAVAQKKDRKFLTAVIAGVDERHRKYEHSVKLLEPNVKNCAGGIRDLHSLVWIHRSSDTAWFTRDPFRTFGSACAALIEQLAATGAIPAGERDECLKAFDGILRLRNELHYLSGAQNDVMEFSKQREVAEHLGYRRTTPVESVESCMRDYFLHARTIHRLNRRLIDRFRANSGSSFWTLRREEVLDAQFKIRERLLHHRVSPPVFTSPAEVLRAYHWSGFHSVSLAPELQTAIHALTRKEPFFRSDDAGASSMLLEILRLPSRVALTLQTMNDNDVLGALMPEWGRLVAFFQHSVYHYYTTDAHTLIALEHAEHLQESGSILGRTFRALPDRVTLYLAILFHDIAKPVGVQGHEVTGVGIWKEVQQRFGIPDEHDDVAFLIRHHLAMEQVAFRRNLEDPASIAEFAALFRRPEQLDLLFLLTYCDLSAVNKTVWSQWKEMLLQDLYLRTRRLLATGTAEEREAEPAQSDGTLRSRYAPLIASLDVVAAEYRHEEAHTVVTIITRDAEFLLATLCGVLAANDAGIFDAQIATDPDGIVIDTFRVVDGATKLPLTADQERSISRDLRSVLTGAETLESLFARYHRRWRRRAKPLFHPNVRIDAVFHESGRHTIIDVYAPDMTGFLYKITETIARNGMRIDFAKLATRGDGIVDSFYVTKNGKRISSEAEKQYLREEILHTIDRLMNVQLDL